MTKAVNNKKRKSIFAWSKELCKELTNNKVLVTYKLKGEVLTMEFQNQTNTGAKQSLISIFPEAVVLRVFGVSPYLTF